MRSLFTVELAPAWREGASDRRGLALVATLIVLAVMGIVVAGAVRAAMTTVRTAGLDYHEARAFYAAEAGAEAALSQIKSFLHDGYLEDSELTVITPPDLEDFSYDSFSVEKRGGAVVETITDGPFAGLYSLTQVVDIYSVAADRNGTVSGVVLGAKAQAIPIFQFGIFYEEDLEGTNGPPLTFVGRVHSNGNIYLSSPNAWYREMITTPNKVFRDRKDYHSILNGVYINDDFGAEVALTFDSRDTPDPETFKAASCANFSCRLKTDAFEVDSLKLPLPDGTPPYELVRPRDIDDGAAEKDVKFSWNADAYLTVDLTALVERTALCGVVGVEEPDDEKANQKWWPTITIERNGQPLPTSPELCDMFQWTWSAFYDAREKRMKDVLDIRMQKVRNWVNADPARTMEIIYVNFIVPTGIATYPAEANNLILDAKVDPALRVRNGALLPNRLSVATDWPLYVKGSYNSAMGQKAPAALVGDGITILSNAWLDSNNRPSDAIVTACVSDVFEGQPCKAYAAWVWTPKAAGGTTINAAFLVGHSATPCDHETAGCLGGFEDFYGGGIENFPRFLENWSGVKMTYRGSLVSLFTNQKTTSTWNLTYYNPPTRDWSFDTDFRNPALLPPGTPNVGNVVRTAMRDAF
jgi:hypothetical protein